MRCKEVTSDFFKMFDLFSISQFLRYNQDEDYRTVSGGITSLLVVSIFAILFAGNAISTLNKTDIAWSSTKEFQFEPSLSNLAFGPSHKNLFTVGMLGVNLNDPTWRYFDIQMVEVMQVGSIFSDVRSIDMVPCTEQHFAMTDTLQGNFNTTESWRRLCPPLDSNFDIFGKLTSNVSKYVEIRVNKCNSSLNSTRTCVNQSQIDNLYSIFGDISVGLFYVNPLINPGNTEYLDYYL